MRRRAACGLALAVAALASAAAIEASAGLDRDLYDVTVFVTGQGEETRGPGLARALGACWSRSPAIPRFAADPAVDRPASRTRPDLVEGFSYRDLMEGIPVHDEQGSRDRPYALTVRFRPGARSMPRSRPSAWRRGRRRGRA